MTSDSEQLPPNVKIRVDSMLTGLGLQAVRRGLAPSGMPGSSTDERAGGILMIDSALLRGILEAPADDAPRLIAADWLDEHGECERAEFIRVQCELSRPNRRSCPCQPRGVMPNGTACQCVWCGLFRRESHLWGHGFGGLDVPPGLDSIALHVVAESNLSVGLVSRGFVAEVRCTLETFVGGPCRRNIGTLPICPDCKGTGRTPGIAERLFRSQPIERVTITNAVVHASGGNDTYYVSNLGVFPQKFWSRIDNHWDRRSAELALFNVCLEYGRELAGLSQMTDQETR